MSRKSNRQGAENAEKNKMRTDWIALSALLVAALPIACGGDSSSDGDGGGGGTTSSTTTSSTTTSSTTTSGGGGSGGDSGGVGGSGGGTGGVGGSGGGTGPECGNGVLVGEECDDGNGADDDGCSATCGVEEGWGCNGEPSSCSPICGDGILLGAEACDDGNADVNDGCTACAVDPGFTCIGAPSVCTAGAVSQVISTGPGFGLDVPDDAYDGTLTSMACVTLDAEAQIITGVTALVGLSHTYIGDLTFKLVSPAGTVVTLMSRPGALEPLDDGADDVFGIGAPIDAAFPVTFETGAATSAEEMGAILADGEVVCQDDGLCDYAPDAGAALPGDLTTLNGESAGGTWQFCAGDSANLDLGVIDLFTLTIN
jgi:cysteine-rich repeat protein